MTMTMTINVTPAGMTQAQREAVAGFILAYPFDKQCVDEGCPQSHMVHECVRAEIADSTVCEELHQLHREASDPAGPLQAFTVDEAQAAFGGASPLPLGATTSPTILASTPAGNVPPPPVATAPTPPTLGPASLVVPAPPAGGSVETDRDGLPYDARIHSSNRAKIADGTWRKKRGVDDALVAQVEAELRQVMGAPAVGAGVPVAPLAPAAPIVTTPAPAAPVGANSPTITASPPVAPPPPASVSHLAPPVGSMITPGTADARQTFVQLVGRSAAAMAAGKLTQQEVTDCCTAAGVPMLPLLANRLDLVPCVAAAIDAIIAMRS